MLRTDQINIALDMMGQVMIKAFGAGLDAKGKNASKGLASSLEGNVIVDSEFYEVDVLGLPYWKWIDQGRPPTSPGAPKGSPTVQEQILQWIQIKGITAYPDAKGRIPNQNQLSYMISHKIHKEGYKGTNLFSDAITAFSANDNNFENFNLALIGALIDLEPQEV